MKSEREQLFEHVYNKLEPNKDVWLRRLQSRNSELSKFTLLSAQSENETFFINLKKAFDSFQWDASGMSESFYGE